MKSAKERASEEGNTLSHSNQNYRQETTAAAAAREGGVGLESLVFYHPQLTKPIPGTHTNTHSAINSPAQMLIRSSLLSITVTRSAKIQHFELLYVHVQFTALNIRVLPVPALQSTIAHLRYM